MGLNKTSRKPHIVKNPQFYVSVLAFPVASIELHANPMWKDLRKFYSLVGLFEKLFKIKKSVHCKIDKY